MNKTDDILNRLQQAQQPRLDNPDELTERILSRLPDRGRPRPQKEPRATSSLAGGGARAPKAWRYAAVGIAASVLLLIGVGVATQRQESHPTELIADNAEKGNHPIESVPTDTAKGNAPVVSVPTDAAKENAPIVSVPNDAAKEDAPAELVPSDAEKENAPSVKVLDANLHYAAYTETKDTSDYLPPTRVDEFVEKLATYHHINAVVLSDSATHSVAYVFPDNDKVRLFDRLLQVACTYSYDSPGYQMTISQQQLLFTLEDTRLSCRYLWLAERIGGGRIILYATHAPTGAAVSSEAYQEFRERTTHTNQTTEL
jgi:hypothetical protein